MAVPAGLDKFFEEIGKGVPAGVFPPPPDMTPEEQKRLSAIAKKYGQEIFPPDYLDEKASRPPLDLDAAAAGRRTTATVLGPLPAKCLLAAFFAGIGVFT